jgi:PAS domain S-box-containing protein
MKANKKSGNSSETLITTRPDSKSFYFSMILVILAGLAILVSVGGYFYFQSERNSMKRNVEAQLNAVVKLKVNQVTSWRQERLSDARNIMADNFFPEGIGELPDAVIFNRIEDRLRAFTVEYPYQDIKLVNVQGRILLSLNNNQYLSPETQTLVFTSFKKEEPTLVDLHLDDLGQPQMDIIAPLYRTSDIIKEPLAAVILNIDPHRDFYPLIQSWPLPEKSAEGLIVRKQGDQVVFLSALKYQEGTALKISFPLSRTDVPAVAAVLGQEGVFEGKDYRGIEVISSVSSIPDTPWYMIAKIDRDEALAAVTLNSILILILIFVLLCITAVVGVMFWQRYKRLNLMQIVRLQTERQAILEQYEHLVKYAGDMIFLFDADFKLVEANERAQEQYGYSSEELTALNVLDLLVPQERLRHSSQLQLSSGSRGYLFESIHQAKDGHALQVEINARMIRMEGRDYLQWIVRDISERKALEEKVALNLGKIEHLNHILRAIRNVNQLIVREHDPQELLREVSRELVETRGFKGSWIALTGTDNGVTSFCESGWEGNCLTPKESAGLIDWCKCAAACLTGDKLVTIPALAEDCASCCLSARCCDAVIITAPLVHDIRKYGIVAVTVDKNAYTEEDQELVKEIASDISFALNAIETESSRKSLELEARRYLDIAGVMIVVLERDGRIKLVNRKAAEILGYKEEEMIGQDWFALCIPDPDPVRSVFQRIMAGDVDQMEYFTNPVNSRDGSVKTISWHNAVIKDENGRILGTISSGEDITQRRKAEQALKDSEEKFRLLYESMSMGVLYQEKNGAIISLNQAAERILGITLDRIRTPEQVDRNLAMVHEDGTFFPAGEHPSLQALKTGLPVYNVIMGLPLDGGKSYRWIVVDAVPQFKPGETTPYQAFVIFNDITSLKLVSRELEERQRFLDMIIDNTPNPLWISDSGGTVIRMNQSLKKLLKLDYSDVVGKYNVFQDSQVISQGYLPLVESVFKEGKTVSFIMDYNTSLESQINPREKVTVILELTISALRDERGRVINAICQHKDITQQRLSEKALKKSEENYRNSLDSSPLGIRIYSSEDDTLYVNRAFLETFGVRDLEEYNAIPHPRRYTPESYRVYLERKRQGQNHEILSPTFRTDIVRKDGKIRHLLVFRKEVQWDGNQQIQAVSQDITEQTLAEERVLKSEIKYRSLVNNVKLGIFRADPVGTGRFIEVNPAMEEITGYNREELLNMQVAELYSDPVERTEFIQQVLTSRDKVSGEFIFKRKDGSKIQVSITDIAIRDDTGRVVFIDGILDNITERKLNETRLLEVESLKQSNKAKSELLANVSHELRTPLASIKGFIETLLEDDVTWSINQQQDFLKSADMETDRLTFLIRDLLDMSRLDSGKMVLDRKDCSIDDVFETVRNILGSLTVKHRLVYEIPPGLPVIDVDKARIGQVITNLVENATKFSRQGSMIRIGVNVEEEQVVVEVEDRGEGMSEEVVANLFNRFYQAERVVSGKTRGTGLGLAICKGIIEAHGGKIWVESHLGQGTVFCFSLPLGSRDSRKDV